MKSAFIGAVIAVVVLGLIIVIGLGLVAGLNFRYGETIIAVAIVIAIVIGAMAGYRRE